MGVAAHLVVGEAAELVAHHVQRLVVEAQRAEIAVSAHRPAARRCACAPRRCCRARVSVATAAGRAPHVGVDDAEIAGAHDLDLAHRRCRPRCWPRYSPKAACRISSSARRARRRLQALGPAPHLRAGRDIGREPGEAVGRELLALQQRAVDLAAAADLAQHGLLGGREEGAGVRGARGRRVGEQTRARRPEPRHSLRPAMVCFLIRKVRAVGRRREGGGLSPAIRLLLSVRSPRRLARGLSTAMLPGLCRLFHNILE